MAIHHYILLSVALTWVMIMTAAGFKTGGVSLAALKLATGNRDNLPPATPLGDRADRAAKNMVENMVLFLTVLVAAAAADAKPSRVLLGCQLFFFARLAYWPVYLIGIRWLRTAIWSVAVAGMALIGASAW